MDVLILGGVTYIGTKIVLAVLSYFVKLILDKIIIKARKKLRKTYRKYKIYKQIKKEFKKGKERDAMVQDETGY